MPTILLPADCAKTGVAKAAKTDRVRVFGKSGQYFSRFCLLNYLEIKNLISVLVLGFIKTLGLNHTKTLGY